MNWKQHLVCRILLIIAKMVADDKLRDELQALYNHIACGEPLKP